MSTPEADSRRDFLRATTATATTIAFGLSLARSAHAAGSDRFNVALVGAGGRGTGAAADCLRVAKHIKLVAIADAFEDRAQLSRKSLQAMFGDQVDVPDERLVRRAGCLQEGNRLRRGPDDPRNAARLSPAALSGRDRGGQARVHGKAALCGCRRFPLADGDEQAGGSERVSKSASACSGDTCSRIGTP